MPTRPSLLLNPPGTPSPGVPAATARMAELLRRQAHPSSGVPCPLPGVHYIWSGPEVALHPGGVRVGHLHPRRRSEGGPARRRAVHVRCGQLPGALGPAAAGVRGLRISRGADPGVPAGRRSGNARRADLWPRARPKPPWTPRAHHRRESSPRASTTACAMRACGWWSAWAGRPTLHPGIVRGITYRILSTASGTRPPRGGGAALALHADRAGHCSESTATSARRSASSHSPPRPRCR